MQPVQPAENWGVPIITTVGDLAAWLGIGASELDWFADLKALTYKTDAQKVSHYHYRVLAKDSGSIRLIEAPKTRLKELQRHILAEILEKIPPHPAVHGFVKGRSIKTFIAPHLGRRVVLRMDLRDFFPSIAGARVQAVFRTIGCPEGVADLLGGICTNVVPRKIWKAADLHGQEIWEITRLYANPHLPQGAPSSPLLANICGYRMDCRLSGLARMMGAQYTRYADDLAFSGDDEFAQRVQHFATYAAAIAIEEGFFVHHRKTRIMRQGVRQHLAGLVANQHLNVIRTDFDRLKATLYNCVRFGPEEHNRPGHPDFRSHLDGRVSFVEMINPEKGQRLRRLFRAIEWQLGV